MSNINVSFKNLEINVLDDEGVNILAYTVPEYQLSMNAKGMVRFIGELVEEVKAVVKAVEITNTSPDKMSPKIGELYYMAMDNIIEVETWNDNEFDKQNWASGRATKDINKAVEILKAAKLSN